MYGHQKQLFVTSPAFSYIFGPCVHPYGKK